MYYDKTRMVIMNSAKIKVATVLVVAALFLLSASACANSSFVAQLPPMLPARYYQCYDINPEELFNAYFAPYSKPFLAEMQYNGEAFVFKNIEITRGMLENRATITSGL